jgi:hypothetical protein
MQYPLDGIANSLRNFSIAGIFIPNRNDILVESNGNYGAANLIGGNLRKLSPPDHGHDNFFPISRCQSLFETDEPFAPAGIGGILPRRLDPLAKKVIVGGGGKGGRTDEMIVERPELFDGVDGADEFDGVEVAGFSFLVFVGGFGFFGFGGFAAAHVEEGEAGFERGLWRLW